MDKKSIKPENARLLVVEDDPNNRLVITRLLKLAGIPQDNIFEIDGDPSVFFAEKKHEIDIVFLDIQLPRKDGYAILKDLKADPSTSGLVVIALTANVMRSDIERARDAGFDGFIGKPIDGRRFTEILARILKGESVWTVS